MFEDQELKELREKVLNMPDEELIEMATNDADQYRREALDFAVAELTRRGYVIEPYDDSADRDGEDDGSTDDVVKYEMLRGPSSDREMLLSQATEIASEFGADNVINISHTVSGAEDIIVIWYRSFNDSQGV